mgnify:CR=1 FL=1
MRPFRFAILGLLVLLDLQLLALLLAVLGRLIDGLPA